MDLKIVVRAATKNRKLFTKLVMTQNRRKDSHERAKGIHLRGTAKINDAPCVWNLHAASLLYEFQDLGTESNSTTGIHYHHCWSDTN